MALKRLETCAFSISAVVSHKSATAPDWEVDGSAGNSEDAGGLSSTAGAGRVTWFKVFTGDSTFAGVGVLSLIASGSVGSCWSGTVKGHSVVTLGKKTLSGKA